MSEWTNPCGGKRWRTLSDGRIEVEGEGVPSYPPGSPQYAYMTCCWQRWGGLIRGAAAKYGVPVSWIVAIMSQETGLWCPKGGLTQEAIVSGDGGYGLMQIQNSTAPSCGGTPRDMLEPARNIDCGAQVLQRQMKRYGRDLPAVAAAYNAGSVRCNVGRNVWSLHSTGDYPGNVLRYSNAAIEAGFGGTSWRFYVGLGLVALGGATAYGIWSGKLRPPQTLARFFRA